MRKSLCVFVVGSLFFLAGCGDDDPTPVQCLVTKITNVLALDGTGSLEFTYANNQLTTITLKTDEDGVIETIPLSVTYTGNNITRLTAQRDLIVITFTYDGSNRITSLLESIDDVEFKREYSYNSNGQLSRSNFLFKDGSTFVLDNYSTFTYANTTTKNPANRMNFFQDGSTAILLNTITYEYDTNNSISKDVPVIDYLFNFTFGENNVTKITETSPGGSSAVTNISYQYNDRNYPTRFTISAAGDPPTTGTAEYICQ